MFKQYLSNYNDEHIISINYEVGHRNYKLNKKIKNYHPKIKIIDNFLKKKLNSKENNYTY